MSNQTTWLGKVSKVWADASNWTKGVPTIGLHAYIPQSNTTVFHPVISCNTKMNFTLKNDGLLEIEAELLIQRKGILQNYGTIKILDIGLINNEGNMINFGEWINEGTCDNKRIFTNHHRAFNEGVLDNANTFVNLGNFVNTGVIDNHQSINNIGTLENFNIVENHGKAEISDQGFFPHEFIEQTDVPIGREQHILSKLPVD